MTLSNRRRIATLTLVAGTVFGGLLAARSSPWSAASTADRVTVELTANTWTGSTQYEPAIAADAEGRMLVAWASRRQEDGAYGVFAQALDPLGRPVGTEIHVNQHVEGAQASPAVAFDRGIGRAMIVWESTHQDGSGAAVVGRWYQLSPMGAHAVTAEIPINAARTGEQTAPSVAIDAFGRALVTWTSDAGAGGRTVALARVFDNQGTPLTDELRLGIAGAHSPIVAASNDGFVVVGSSRDDASHPAPLWIQRVGGDLTVGEPVAVAQTDASQDIEPALGVDAAGRTVIAWMRRGELGYNVMRRTFDAHGVAITPEAIVAANDGRWLSGVAVASAPDGRSVVSWNVEDRIAPPPADGHEREARGSDVLAVRFDSDGAALGEPTRVNTYAEGRQRQPIGAVAARSIWTGLDQIACVWNGRTGSDSNGVGVTISRPASLTAPEPIAFEPRPAVTPEAFDATVTGSAAPVFDPDFVPEPPDVNTRGVGPDFGFLGDQSTGARPPDPEIAVGPDHVVVVVNSRLTIRRKSDGVQTYARTISGPFGFWGEVGAGLFVFDPIAQYDTYTDRFVVAAGEHTAGQMYLDIAISDDSDPNGVWIKHRVNMTAFGTGMDYPILGIDDGSISITSNFFGDPVSAWIFVFDKAVLIAGSVSLNPVQVSTFNPPTGAMMSYDADAPAQYFASPWSDGNNRLRLMAITDPNGTPQLFEHQLAVPTFFSPSDSEQLGSTNLADTVDWRIKHGVVRNGSMWVAHNTNVTEHGAGGPFEIHNTAKVRWYEVQLNGWPTSGFEPTLAQSGQIDGGYGVYSWHPDISVDDAGNAAIVFNRSSADEHISAARAVRRSTDPPGTFRQAVKMQISTTPELEDRWGDYSGIQEDPVNPGVFWGHSEYRTSSWRTWVGRFSPLSPNPLDFALLWPSGDATEVGVGATLDWEDAEDADSYDVVIATDPALLETVAIASVSGSAWTIPEGTLACGAVYYWGVVANGVGGTSVSTPGVASFTTGLAADLNGDNIVDTSDLGVLLGAFGTAGPTGDVNGDNIVDTSDLGLLIGAFGQVCN